MARTELDMENIVSVSWSRTEPTKGRTSPCRGSPPPQLLPRPLVVPPGESPLQWRRARVHEHAHHSGRAKSPADYTRVFTRRSRSSGLCSTESRSTGVGGDSCTRLTGAAHTRPAHAASRPREPTRSPLPLAPTFPRTPRGRGRAVPCRAVRTRGARPIEPGNSPLDTATAARDGAKVPMTSPAAPRPQPASPASQPPPPDLFVLVRPPPGSSAHPLNLQVQLLVPSTAHHHPRPAAGGVSATSLDKVAGASVSRDGEIQHEGAEAGGGRRASASSERARTRSSSRGRASPGAGGAGAGSGRVSRSPSMSSLASGRSGYSAYSGESMGTASSFTGTGGTGRRKVTPLLNLAFHSVLPTVVTDAGA